MPTDYSAIQKRIDELKGLPYSQKLKEEIEKLISEVPLVKDDTPRAEKVVLYCLRAKALLLLPTFSAEAEADLNKALKLDPSSSPDTYIALSECLWRKNQEQEAVDAAQSALSIDAKYIPALCQLSRLVRALATKEGSTEEQRANYLHDSIMKAKEALGVDINSGEAWSALGLAHIQVAVATGFGYIGMKKALAAMQQAVVKCPNDPDIHYNLAVVLESTGNYSLAAVEYAKAALIDPLLKGANASANSCKALLERYLSVETEAKKNENLKKELLFKLPASKAANGVVTKSSIAEILSLSPSEIKAAKGHMLSVMVIGLISPQGAYPLCYQCIDRNGQTCMLLVPRLQSSAVSRRDVVTVTFPPSAISAVEQKNVMADDKKTLVDVQSVVIAADPDSILVNNAPVANSLFTLPQMSSRVFQ
eukprot:GILI01013373.1.p1 GENE.GILI01013373.1~~GILI01013373.1.p1  ORF type:complete len:421 (+),score=121.65 GILI01013373.1:82-1344(+)